MTNYKNLEAWKKSMELVREVYILTKKYPKEELYALKEELYALTSQTKRAAISVPANIAEGSGRNYKKDTIQFLHISRGSLYELETLLNIAVMIDIISEEQFEPFVSKLDECLKILNGLITYYERASLK